MSPSVVPTVSTKKTILVNIRHFYIEANFDLKLKPSV